MKIAIEIWFLYNAVHTLDGKEILNSKANSYIDWILQLAFLIKWQCKVVFQFYNGTIT